MKQLFILLFMFTSLAVFAQDVDETMLEGKWVRSSASGDFNPYKRYGEPQNYSLQKPDVIIFYDDPSGVYQDDSLGMVYCCDPHSPVYEYNPETWQSIPTGEYEERWDHFGIMDYFITKNNILHISIEGGRRIQRFKIMAFDGSNITLSTMNGKGTVTYRREQTSEVRSVRRVAKDDPRYYSIDGKQLSEEPRKGIYIKNKQKYVK